MTSQLINSNGNVIAEATTPISIENAITFFKSFLSYFDVYESKDFLSNRTQVSFSNPYDLTEEELEVELNALYKAINYLQKTYSYQFELVMVSDGTRHSRGYFVYEIDNVYNLEETRIERDLFVMKSKTVEADLKSILKSYTADLDEYNKWLIHVKTHGEQNKEDDDIIQLYIDKLNQNYHHDIVIDIEL